MSARIPEDTWRRLLRKAVQAPSGDNCQPWGFHCEADALVVTLDPDRGRHFLNVANRATHVALGALLENLDLAASAEGYEIKTDLLAHDAKSPAGVKVQLVPAVRTADPLHSFIDVRCTNRKPYERLPLEAKSRELLLDAARGVPGARLSLVEDPPLIDRLARIACLSDRTLFENKSLHQSLFHWVRWNQRQVEATRDGLDIRTLELDPLTRMAFPLLGFWPFVTFITHLGIGRYISEVGYHHYRRSAAIGLLQVADFSPRSFIAGGRLLQRVWLSAAAVGLSFQPLAGVPILIQKLCDESSVDLSPRQRALIARAELELNDLIPIEKGSACVMMFRIGVSAPPTARSLRRPVAIAG